MQNVYTCIWVFPKIMVSPNHSLKNRVFHCKPSILGLPYPIFGNTHFSRHIAIWSERWSWIGTTEEVESKLGGLAGDHTREGGRHSKAKGKIHREKTSFMFHPCWNLHVLRMLHYVCFYAFSYQNPVEQKRSMHHSISSRVKTSLRKSFCTFCGDCGAV